MSTPLHLVFCTDENYVAHLLTTLVSIGHNANSSGRLRCWILSSGLSDESKMSLRRAAGRWGMAVEYLQINESMLSAAPAQRNSLATYYRLLIPSVLPVEVTRCLYLDGDLVVESDVTALAESELGEHAVGGVLNPGFNRHESLGLLPTVPYFNAGVLVVDLVRWRAAQISERALEFIVRKPSVLKTWDQDALNAVIAGAWHPLDPRWNQQYSFWIKGRREFHLTRAEWRNVLYHPFIVHYSSKCKPWHFTNDHPLRSRYHHYRQLAGLPPVRLYPKNAKDIIWRGFKYVMPHRTRSGVQQLLTRMNT